MLGITTLAQAAFRNERSTLTHLVVTHLLQGEIVQRASPVQIQADIEERWVM